MARRVIALMAVLLVVLLIGMFAFAYLAIDVTKEIHHANGELVDSDGRRLSTSPRSDELQSGITVNQKRLLSAANPSNEVNRLTALEVPVNLYNKVKQDFANGRTDIMVPLPEGFNINQTLTVEIKGYSAKFDLFYGTYKLNGIDSIWMASCKDGQTMCPIKVRPPAGARLRRLHDRSMPREADTDSLLDRSLCGKSTWC
jgi:hypothetical protein